MQGNPHSMGSKGFKVAILAHNIQQAKRYIIANRSCIAYQTLKFISKGQPSDPQNWLAVNAIKY